MRFLFIVFFIPVLGLSQSSQKKASRKLTIVELQKTADSINRLLNLEINKETHQVELEKLYQKQEKIQLASRYLIKAKRKRATGFIITGINGLNALICFQVIKGDSGNPDGIGFNFPTYLIVSAGAILIGWFSDILLFSSATNNIQKASELIREVKITPS